MLEFPKTNAKDCPLHIYLEIDVCFQQEHPVNSDFFILSLKDLNLSVFICYS